MSSLLAQTAAFKKQVALQPVYSRPKASPAHSSTVTVGNEKNIPRMRLDGTNTGAGMVGKKKSKKLVYSQPTDTGAVKHTMSQLHNVINFLKERVDKPQNAEDLKKHKIADVNANKELYQLMINNEKIDFDSVNLTFKYKPEFLIRGNEDLIQLLHDRKDSKQSGMHFKDLADSYVDVTGSIQELEQEGRILVIRLMKDNSPRLMFWNDTEENTPMDKEFVGMFHQVKIPDEVDLPKALSEAGLQTMAVLENKSRIENKPKQRKRKQGNRKIKITNTHIDLDLTKDYTPNKS